MREVKKHWRGLDKKSLCGLAWIRFANKKRAVTCLRCQRMLAGYKGEVK